MVPTVVTISDEMVKPSVKHKIIAKKKRSRGKPHTQIQKHDKPKQLSEKQFFEIVPQFNFNDREFIFDCVTNGLSKAFSLADKAIKKDKDFILTLLSTRKLDFFFHVDKTLQLNSEFMLQCIRKNEAVIQFVLPALLEHDDFVKTVFPLCFSDSSFKKIEPCIQKNRGLGVALFTVRPDLFLKAPKYMQVCDTYALEAVKFNPVIFQTFEKICEDHLSNLTIGEVAVRGDPFNIRFVKQPFDNEYEYVGFLVEMANEIPDCLQHLHKWQKLLYENYNGMFSE